MWVHRTILRSYSCACCTELKASVFYMEEIKNALLSSLAQLLLQHSLHTLPQKIRFGNWKNAQYKNQQKQNQTKCQVTNIPDNKVKLYNTNCNMTLCTSHNSTHNFRMEWWCKVEKRRDSNYGENEGSGLGQKGWKKKNFLILHTSLQATLPFWI